jgi:hypothetical protein
MHVIGRALRVRRCGEDGAAIALQQLKPGRDIGGMVGPEFGR